MGLLLTIAEMSEKLRVSEKTIYYWTSRNEIPFIKVGRHLRFREQQVMEHFEKRTLESKPACFTEPSFTKLARNRSLKISRNSSAQKEE